MKSLQLLLVATCLAAGAATSQTAPETASQAPFSATYMTADKHQHVWIFGEGATNGKGLYHNFNGWKYIPYDLAQGINSAHGTYGRMLVTNARGEIKEWIGNNGAWFQYKGLSEVRDACWTNVNGQVLALGKIRMANGTTKSGVFSATNITQDQNGWKEEYSGGLAAGFIKLAATKDGHWYFVATDGKLYKRQSGEQEIKETSNGGHHVVDVLAGDDGSLYIRDKNNNLFKQTASGFWSRLMFSATSFGIDENGNVYGTVGDQAEGLVAGKWERLTIANANVLDAGGNTPLTAAALLNDMTKAKAAITAGADPNMRSSKGDIPLTIATKNNNLDMVNLLISNKADVNNRDSKRHTALYYSVENGNKQIAQALLIAKADTKSDPKAVMMAVEKKNKEMLLMLSTYNADLTPGFTKAAEMNDAEMFQSLFTYGGKLTTNEPLEMAIDKNNTAIAGLCLDNGASADHGLGYAMSKNNTAMIGLCLQKGAKPGPVVKHAVKTNNTTLIQQLIDQHGVQAQTILTESITYENNGTTVAKGAIKKVSTVNTPIAEIALQRGADGNPHLRNAVASNHPELYNLLLKYNADATQALKYSVERNNVTFADAAIKGGAQTMDPALMKMAVDTNNTDMARLLLDNGALANDPYLLKTSIAKKNSTIAMMLLDKGAPAGDPEVMVAAVQSGDINLVTALLDKGADPSNGIKSAVTANNTAMAQLLFDRGAAGTDPELISIAAKNGNLDLCERLVSVGALPNNGMESAISYGKEPIFNYLIDAGAFVSDSKYAMLAVTKNQVNIFNRLMSLGAPTDFNSQSNENLLHLSARVASYPMTQKLIEKGVSVTQKSSSGDTPLHVAASTGRNNVDLAKLLVDNGADVNARNNRGKSIMKVAKGKKLKDYLKSQGASK